MNDGTPPRDKLHVTDRASGIRFLIDTGSDISLLPRSHGALGAKPTSFQLFAANGSLIDTFGEKVLSLDLGLRRSFTWRFCVANVTRPIIGADLLQHYGLLVDLQGKRLLDKRTNCSVTGTYSRITQVSILTINPNSEHHTLLKGFPDLTRPAQLPTVRTHGIHHYIETRGPPVASRPRRLPVEKLKVAKEAFRHMVEAGVCRPSSSPWAAPLHLVPKKQAGSWRPCGDFRGLNKVTTTDKYPLPHIHDFANGLQGKNVFSTIDLDKAYYQVPVNPSDVPKTAVTTPFGLFEFLVMPFGLRNAAQTFQRLMNKILAGLDFCFCYVDDILVASASQEEHIQHLKQLFSRLSEAGITINSSKCVFGVQQIEFLGYLITENGTKPLPHKVNAILDIPRPQNIADLRRFLGMLNYFRRHLRDAAKHQAPLNEYLKDSRKNDRRTITWTQQAIDAFERCKQELAQATLLAHPVDSAPLTLTTDASGFAIGAALNQDNGEQKQPIAFFSKKLSQTQRNYSTYDRELLAIYESIKYFKYIIQGRELTIETDHKPLIYAFDQGLEKASPRQARQLDLIAQFTTRIIYIAGEQNTVADTLSRTEAIDMPVIVTTAELAAEQSKDKELQSLLKSDTALQLKECTLPNIQTPLFCDISKGAVRPYVPATLRRRIFDAVHNLSHPSGRATSHQIRQKFVWPSINKDIVTWARTCLPCQRAKIHRHTKQLPDKIPTPDQRFYQVHLDIIGPLPAHKNYRYCLTMIDRFSRWPEAIPLTDITAETVATAVINGWVSRFGVPAVVTTDQGRQFEAELFKAFTNFLGTNKTRTTAYHPAANGLIERWHRSLKTAICCHVDQLTWVDRLPLILLGLRSCYKDDIKCSTAELLYGTTLRIPGEFFENIDFPVEPDMFVQQLRQKLRKIRPSPASHHGKRRVFKSKDLERTSHVFLREEGNKRPLQPPYTGPHQVVERVNEKMYTVLVNDKKINISTERLKPAYLPEADEPDEETAPTTPTTTAENPPEIKPLRVYPAKKKVVFIERVTTLGRECMWRPAAQPANQKTAGQRNKGR